MDFVIPFLQERWFVVLAVIVVLIIVIKVVKTVVKWVIVLALVAGLFYYGASYKEQLLEFGTMAAATVTAEVKEQAAAMIQNEMKEAKYEARPDGSFVVQTKSVKLEGTAGGSELQITFLSKTFTVKADSIWNSIIEQAKSNAGKVQ